MLGVGLQQITNEQFLQTARKQLQIREVTEAVSPEQVLQHAAAFRTFWEQMYAPTGAQMQYPLEGQARQTIVAVATRYFSGKHGDSGCDTVRGFCRRYEKMEEPGAGTGAADGLDTIIAPAVVSPEKSGVVGGVSRWKGRRWKENSKITIHPKQNVFYLIQFPIFVLQNAITL